MWSISESNKEFLASVLQNTKLFFEFNLSLREGAHYKSVHSKISETETLYKQKYCYSYSAKNISVSVILILIWRGTPC